MHILHINDVLVVVLFPDNLSGRAASLARLAFLFIPPEFCVMLADARKVTLRRGRA